MDVNLEMHSISVLSEGTGGRREAAKANVALFGVASWDLASWVCGQGATSPKPHIADCYFNCDCHLAFPPNLSTVSARRTKARGGKQGERRWISPQKHRWGSACVAASRFVVADGLGDVAPWPHTHKPSPKTPHQTRAPLLCVSTPRGVCGACPGATCRAFSLVS